MTVRLILKGNQEQDTRASAVLLFFLGHAVKLERESESPRPTENMDEVRARATAMRADVGPDEHSR